MRGKASSGQHTSFLLQSYSVKSIWNLGEGKVKMLSVRISQAAHTKNNNETSLLIRGVSVSQEAPGFWWFCVNRDVCKGDWGRDGEEPSFLRVHAWGDVTTSTIHRPVGHAVATNDQNKIHMLVYNDICNCEYNLFFIAVSHLTHLTCKARISLWGLPSIVPSIRLQTWICWWDWIP